MDEAAECDNLSCFFKVHGANECEDLGHVCEVHQNNECGNLRPSL